MLSPGQKAVFWYAKEGRRGNELPWEPAATSMQSRTPSGAKVTRSSGRELFGVVSLCSCPNEPTNHLVPTPGTDPSSIDPDRQTYTAQSLARSRYPLLTELARAKCDDDSRCPLLALACPCSLTALGLATRRRPKTTACRARWPVEPRTPAE